MIGEKSGSAIYKQGTGSSYVEIEECAICNKLKVYKFLKILLYMYMYLECDSTTCEDSCTDN